MKSRFDYLSPLASSPKSKVPESHWACHLNCKQEAMEDPTSNAAMECYEHDHRIGNNGAATWKAGEDQE